MYVKELTSSFILTSDIKSQLMPEDIRISLDVPVTVPNDVNKFFTVRYFVKVGLTFEIVLIIF